MSPSRLLSHKGIVNPAVEQYMLSLQPARDSVLQQMEEDARENDVPIVGPLVGSLLAIICRACNARNVLEIGTATGYSAIWFARAVEPNGGKVTTIEYESSRRQQAEQHFRKAEVEKIVQIIPGDAKDIVPEMAGSKKGSYDVVFIDVGEKTLYVDLLPYCLSMLRVGGFLLADNALWRGAVADKSDRSKATTSMKRFNNLLFSNTTLDTVIVPLRDGVAIAYKRRPTEAQK